MKPLQQTYTQLVGKVTVVELSLLGRRKTYRMSLKAPDVKTGVEAKVVWVLDVVGVEIQRYHSCSLAGMDIKKLFANASFVFDEFEEKMKEKRDQNNDCEMTDKQITTIYNRHIILYLIWDG